MLSTQPWVVAQRLTTTKCRGRTEDLCGPAGWLDCGNSASGADAVDAVVRKAGGAAGATSPDRVATAQASAEI